MSTRYEGARNRCDVCGRFIPYDDFAYGHAKRNLITPDSAFTREEWETLCYRHTEKRQRPAEAPGPGRAAGRKGPAANSTGGDDGR